MFTEKLSISNLTPPHSTHPARQIYERAYMEGDDALTALCRVDVFIEKMRSSSCPVDSKLKMAYDSMEQMLKVINQLEKSSSQSIHSIYQLGASATTMPEQIFVPQIFESPESTVDERLVVTENLVSTSTMVLERLIYERQKINSNQKLARRRDLTDTIGLTNELTFLAAINANYDPGMTALVSLVHEDRYEGVDAWVFARKAGGCWKVPVQIKSSSTKTAHKSDSLLINMGEYNYNHGLTDALIHYTEHGELSPKASSQMADIVSQINCYTANHDPSTTFRSAVD